MTQKLLYDSIRTSNMVPDRSADITFTEPSLTQQQFLAECDINTIVDANNPHKLITHLNERTPQWGDFGDSTDYQSHQNYIAEANSQFYQLPAETRARFKNNPAELLDFVQNPANQEEAINLGLATRKPQEPSTAPGAPEMDDIPRPSKKSTPRSPDAAEE